MIDLPPKVPINRTGGGYPKKALSNKVCSQSNQTLVVYPWFPKEVAKLLLQLLKSTSVDEE